ncbi:MAG TPA: NADH-quinone oxidoreductase subunit NuoG [Bryobacteraceae bacterium]|nr:NADH-quinone oxidoreductase subunit NuoG [Bryobacteraceae bacterium]
MAKVWVDNRAYEMDPGQNLLHACLGFGMNLPYFCWHPALGSVGACRQCAVKQFKDEKDQHGKIVMACMTPAAEGTRISIQDAEAVEFRRAVVEGLMLNHPHDCPVCDEGGECHLQDMTVMTGHDYRQYAFEKRTFHNQYLGPFLNHEMNRCIQCYRCVRFYREYAGGNDLNSFSLRNMVYFGRDRDGVLENEFAGNLAEVCPTGVFTDATAKRHYTRKWDMQFGPSICVHCGVGCNTSAAERYGTLRRIVNRYHGELNGYFLCDRGRYGYEFVNSPRRIREARLQGKGVPREEALARLKELVADGAVGIGSPRASLESNFALRALVGASRFYSGMGKREAGLLRLVLQVMRQGPARIASLREMEACDAVLVLGEDVTNTAPRMALSLRQAVRQQSMELAAHLKIPLWMDHAVREAAQDQRAPLFVASVTGTRLDDVAALTFHGAPEDLARLGWAVAEALGDGGDGKLDAETGRGQEITDAAAEIARALKSARRPLIVSGTGCGSEAVIEAAANVASALPAAMLALAVPECNSLGVALMDAAALDVAAGTRAETLIVLENDLYRRAPAEWVDAFLAQFRHVVVLDHLENAVSGKAELVLPAATFAESDGTLVNHEGRAQRFFQAMEPAEAVLASWRWLGEWRNLDEVLAAMAGALPQLAGAVGAAPPSTFRQAGERIPREPHRSSGRTAMLANISVHEPKPPEDTDAPLAFSMEGYPDEPPPPLIPFFWTPGWNSYQAVNKFQEEIAGPLRGGPAGVRLVEPGRGNGSLGEVPAGFAPRAGEWLLVGRHHIFGSEELSRQAPGVAELAPQAYVALNPEDAAAFGGEVTVAGRRVPVRHDAGLPRGVAAIPVGIAGFEGIELPQWSRISPV